MPPLGEKRRLASQRGAPDALGFVSKCPGIQALERAAPGLPMKPGKVERHEFEYRRHCTQTLIAGFDVTTGKVGAVIGDTRTEQDFARFLDTLLSSAAANTRWVSSATTSTSTSPSPSFASWRSVAASTANSASKASPACLLQRQPAKRFYARETIASLTSSAGIEGVAAEQKRAELETSVCRREDGHDSNGYARHEPLVGEKPPSYL
jgi:hypothetical protein